MLHARNGRNFLTISNPLCHCLCPSEAILKSLNVVPDDYCDSVDARLLHLSLKSLTKFRAQQFDLRNDAYEESFI